MVGPEALVDEILFWIRALQRECRVPTDEFAFISLVAAREGVSEFELVLPTNRAAATAKCAQWIQSYLNSDESTRPPVSSLLPKLYEEMRPFGEGGLNRFYFAQAALRQQIPFHKIGTIYALGLGKNSRLLFSSLTDRTSALGAKVASNKQLCSTVLRVAGFPVPRNASVMTSEEAVAAAEKLGFPVVVKPSNTDQGIGVSANLPDDERVKKAFAAARKVSDQILVESHVFGATHRLTVFEDKIVRVSKRITGCVIGDGSTSIKDLVTASQAVLQQSGRFRINKTGSISLDEEALDLMAQNGLSPDSIPDPGNMVALRRRDNLNAGGTNETIDLATVHPDNLDLARSVASFLRMDFTGVDLISSDITQSWRSNGAAICEVNSMPQFGVADVSEFYEDCVRSLVPNGGKIEVSLYISCDEAATVERLRREDQFASISAKPGLWINGMQCAKPFANAYAAAIAALLRPETDHLKCVMGPGDILRFGLPCLHIDHLHVCDDLAGMQKERDWALAAVRLHLKRLAEP
jgi:cyanophycin synthetase